MKSYCSKYLLFLILLLTLSISGCGEEEQIKVTDTRFFYGYLRQNRRLQR